MKVISLSIFSILLFVSASVAQSDWAAVRDLKAGTRVVIVERSGTETKARLTRADDTTVFLDKGRTIARDSIARVYLTRRGPVLKRALIGVAAGAGVGIGIGAGVVAATKGDPLIAAGGFLIGIPSGAAIGAATTGTKRGRLIYSSQ